MEWREGNLMFCGGKDKRSKTREMTRARYSHISLHLDGGQENTDS